MADRDKEKDKEKEEDVYALIGHITSVEEVQVYYRDDGRVSVKVQQLEKNQHQ